MPVKKTDYDKYVGKKVTMFISQNFPIQATIVDVDDLGFTFKITKDNRAIVANVNDIVFYNHATPLNFIVKE